MLKGNNSQEIAVYVIWSSQLGAREKHVAEAAKLMSDPRARHYWDPEQLAGKSYQDFLDLPSPAWDLWMLFDREARWQESVSPEPAWWEHQLGGLPKEKKLDPKRFADKAAELLAQQKAASLAAPGASPKIATDLSGRWPDRSELKQ